MPQASDELRDKMGEYFGDRIDDRGPSEFLRSRGFELGVDWQWRHPEHRTIGEISDKEYHCILFLVHEWDYGGLKDASKE